MTDLTAAGMRAHLRLMVRDVLGRFRSDDVEPEKVTPNDALALAHAIDHVSAAHRHIIDMPDAQQEAEHAEKVIAMHAHVKAADHYLDRYRSFLNANPQGEGDGDPDIDLSDPETRAIRQSTRAAAAVTLAVAGETGAAARLVGAPKPRL